MRNRAWAIVCVAVSAVAATVADRSAAIERQNGVNFHGTFRGAHARMPDGSFRDQASYASLKSTGANWLSLNVAVYQDTIESTQILLDASSTGKDGRSFVLTPSDDEIAAVVKRAHDDGLKVMLKPYVAPKTFLTDPNVWHGLIGTRFTSEPQWQQWFESYTAFLRHYATLAHRCEVDQLCIGTELQGTDHRTEDWRKVIRAVRSVYHGPLVYAAHFENAEAIQWWGDLDYIGVDAYYPLTDTKNPTVAELKQGWQRHIQTLERLHRQWDRPILFTEIGYPSFEGANMRPWAIDTKAASDLVGQKNLYQAFFEEVYGRPWLHGVYWWVWFWNLDLPDLDRNYPPYGKPAEDVLRAWYRQTPGSGTDHMPSGG